MAQKKKNKRRRRQFQQKVILSDWRAWISDAEEREKTDGWKRKCILFGFVILSCWGQFRADIGFQPGGGDYTDA